MTTPEGRLLRSYRAGRAKGAAFLEDYASLANALVDLYEATFDAEHLAEAVRLADVMLADFADPEGGGFYFTPANHESLIVRLKDPYDGATPSGNSLAVGALLRLARLCDRDDFRAAAERTLETYAETMARVPRGFHELLVGLYCSLAPSQEIAVVGTAGDEPTRAMLRAIRGRFLPSTVIAFREAAATKTVAAPAAARSGKTHPAARRQDSRRRSGHGVRLRELRLPSARHRRRRARARAALGGSMADENHIPLRKALAAIAERLKSIDHAWVVTGSVGLTLHGLEVPVRDIDLRTTEDGAYEIERRLLGGAAEGEGARAKSAAAKRENAAATSAAPVEAVRFLESPRIRSHFGAVTLLDFRVEIMGNMETLASNGAWEESIDLRCAAHLDRFGWRSAARPAARARAHRVSQDRPRADAELIDRWIVEHRDG